MLELSFNTEDVHLWRIDLNREDEVARLHSILSEDERARSAQFKTAQLRRRYVIAHGALREILSRYLATPSTDVRIVEGKNQKPELDPQQNKHALNFNLSHSHERALVALTRSSKVGVDVEHVRVIDDALQLANRFFSPKEAMALQKLPPLRRQDFFLRQWTAKEAFLKAQGLGLEGNLKRFSVWPTAGSDVIQIEREDSTGEAWTLRSVEVANDYIGAFAVQKLHVSVTTLFDWAPSLTFRCKID